jgi:hypothetical protein
MRILLSTAALFTLATTLPCAAEDYYGVMAAAKHGNGYGPATVVAGWEQQATLSVLSLAPNGGRQAGGTVSEDWKAILITGPKSAPQDDDNDDDERYQDRRATSPKPVQKPAGAPAIRREVSYSSLTCPALMTQIAALKALASFDFNLPDPQGNRDGANGNGHQGFDLWIRVGDAELTKSAGTPQSRLGQWFQQTTAALAACPAQVKPAT